MVLRVTLHAYQSDPSLPQRDGVNVSHGEVDAMMRALNHSDLKVEFHDFYRLCCDRRYARDVLTRTDCVLSNVGPHAHYYYYLREQLGLSFRILRDFRTAFWSSYLLQEALCQHYLRPGDALIVPSRYARAISRRIFPHLREHPILVFESLFTVRAIQRHCAEKANRRRKTVTLGYVGRLSEDKNFPQLVDLLIMLNREQPGRYRLIACGDVHSPSCEPGKVHARVRAETRQTDLFEYHPARDHADVWAMYGRFDVFLFPSTSNLETPGRVLAEASWCGIPVLASEHAAAPELLPAQALSPVRYTLSTWYPTHFDYPLGTVDIDDMARKLECGELVQARCHLSYRNDPEFLLNLLLAGLGEGDEEGGPTDLAESQRRFLDMVELSGLTDYRDRTESDAVVAELLRWFIGLQQQSGHEYQLHLVRLLKLTRHEARTRAFIEKSKRTRGDFTNLGGVDVEICNVAHFWPQFRLEARSHESGSQAAQEIRRQPANLM